MKKLACAFISLLLSVLMCGCGEEPKPEATAPVINYIPSEDGISRDSIMPLHIQSGTSLLRVYYSASVPVSRVMSRSFAFYYGGREYTVFKYYRQENILYFGGDYTVSEGQVYCTLYRYSGGELTRSEQNVLADSVVFADYPAIAYITVRDGVSVLKYRIKDIEQTVNVDTGVTKCAFVNRYNQLVYLRGNDGESSLMYFDTVNKPVSLGPGGELLDIDIASGRVIVLDKNRDPLFASVADITVYYPLENKSYALQNVDIPANVCVNEYVLADGRLLYLTADGPRDVAAADACFPVNGTESVMFLCKERAGLVSGGKVRYLPKNSVGIPFEAYGVKETVYYRTAEGLYDGDGRFICGAARLVYDEGMLYAAVEDANGTTCRIINAGSGLTVASGILNEAPFYVVGGRVFGFVKSSLTGSELNLVCDGKTVLRNADPDGSVYGSPDGEFVAFCADGSLVIMTGGKTVLTVTAGKLCL